MHSAFPFCGNFNFLVEIEDLEGETTSVVGGFAEVSGLETSSEVLEYHTGSQPYPVKIPGRTRYSNLVLRKGVTTSPELYRWRRRIEEGKADIRSGAIILLDSAHEERARWNFYGAWPCRYEAPHLDAQDNAVSVETLELCVERVERVETQPAG